MCFLFGLASTTAQNHTQDYIEWRFAVKKTRTNTFNVHITALIDAPWRIYTELLDIHESSLFNITFSPNDNIFLTGDLHISGVQIEHYDDVIKERVRYYKVAVNFVQKVSLIVDEPQTLKGTIGYVIGDGKSKVEAFEENFRVTINE